MKAIIILSLTAITQTAFSQQQQQIQSRNILVNNISNVSFQSNIGALNNIQVNFNNNEQKQQVRNVVRATPARKYTQVKTNTANLEKKPAHQVRRRSRPRTVIIAPQTLSQPKVVNVPATNVLLNASDINTPSQNVILENNFEIQSQGISNVANEDSNPFVQQENNNSKESLQINTNLDLSLNLKGASIVRSRASSSSSSSGSHSKSHVFSKKLAKFKRNFFGKLSSHKKGSHRLDLCFSW